MFSKSGNLHVATNNCACKSRENRTAPRAHPGRRGPEPSLPSPPAPHLPPCIAHRSGTLEMWTDLDGTCVKAASIRFCGGQHLDHITAYSTDGLPVLELCRRSDSQRVIASAIGTHQPMSRTLSNAESNPNPNQNEPPPHSNPDAIRSSIPGSGVKFVGVHRRITSVWRTSTVDRPSGIASRPSCGAACRQRS